MSIQQSRDGKISVEILGIYIFPWGLANSHPTTNATSIPSFLPSSAAPSALPGGDVLISCKKVRKYKRPNIEGQRHRRTTLIAFVPPPAPARRSLLPSKPIHEHTMQAISPWSFLPSFTGKLNLARERFFFFFCQHRRLFPQPDRCLLDGFINLPPPPHRGLINFH